MRFLLFVLFAAFAMPALAQQERECRGKQAIDLGDGAAGCILKVDRTTITTTLTRDDGAGSKTKRNSSPLINVALFGAYSDQKPVIGNRIKAVCRAMLPQLAPSSGQVSSHRIVVVLVWPRVANPGTLVPKSEAEVAVHPAYTSGKCRGVKFFG